jgi:hypothetical protein
MANSPAMLLPDQTPTRECQLRGIGLVIEIFQAAFSPHRRAFEEFSRSTFDTLRPRQHAAGVSQAQRALAHQGYL